MTQIDGSLFLSSPLFVSKPQNRVWIRRATQSVDSDGVLVESEPETIEITAIVQPASPNTLRQLPDGMQTNVAVELWTTFRVEAPSQGRSGDQVVWQGRVWMVRSVRDWTTWGRGFVHAVAEALGPMAESVSTANWDEFRWDEGTRWA